MILPSTSCSLQIIGSSNQTVLENDVLFKDTLRHTENARVTALRYLMLKKQKQVNLRTLSNLNPLTLNFTTMIFQHGIL